MLWVIESGAIVQPGDELVRLDKSFIQEQIDERTKYAHWSQSAADHSAARLASAELAVAEYQQGRYVAELMTLEKNLTVAKSRLTAARNMLEYTELMSKSGYKSELEIEEKEFAVDQAELDVQLKQTQIESAEEIHASRTGTNVKRQFGVDQSHPRSQRRASYGRRFTTRPSAGRIAALCRLG